MTTTSPVDIVERLRTADFDTVTQEDLRDAVAEIVRLRSLLAPADDDTPLLDGAP